MNASRQDLLARLRELMDGRPVRWAGPPELVGDYDGRERTLEVFNADGKDQRALLGRLRPFRPDLEAAAGGAVIVIFHTIAESARLHAEFVQAVLREEATRDTEIQGYDVPDDIPPLAVDIEVNERTADTVGSTDLPRVAA